MVPLSKMEEGDVQDGARPDESPPRPARDSLRIARASDNFLKQDDLPHLQKAR
jgi:hypothetical protein